MTKESVMSSFDGPPEYRATLPAVVSSHKTHRALCAVFGDKFFPARRQLLGVKHVNLCDCGFVLRRFYRKIQERGSLCYWEWTSTKYSNGYGRFNGGFPEYKPVLAHRFSYESVYGKIPLGLVIDHLCENPSCVDPGHLEVVTRAENNVRSTHSPAAKNGRKKRCVKGHPLSGDNLVRAGLKLGWRMCRKCGIRRAKEQYLRGRRTKVR